MNNAKEVIDEFNKAHGSWGSYGYDGTDSQFVRNLKHAGLSDENIASVITIMDETCSDCFNNDDGCSCWNDE